MSLPLSSAQQKGQLGRPILDMPYWNAKPSPMPNIGAKYGRKATWIGASGDQTFLRIDEALINSHVLATSEIFASKHIIGLVPSFVSEPPPFKCLLINKMDGSCRTFNDSEQEDLQGFGLCLDPVYDVIWRSVKHWGRLSLKCGFAVCILWIGITTYLWI